VETLAERIQRDGPVSELDAIGWAIRLAKRLEALHGLGVAHGSVSPACIIAAGQDRNARAYLADVQHTSPSPAYQSPERILGGDISQADDVWALAATLYALLTGQSPFSGASDAEVRQKILAASPAPLAVFDVGDDDLQHILDACFAREMPRRTSSVTAFRRALEEWHPDRGVANLPPLEDEDSTNDDDDGARTMLVRDSANYMQQSLGIPLPKANADDDDDDEDNIRTQMRQLPGNDLAAIIARAQAQAAAGGGFPAPPQPAPAPPAPAPAPPAPFGGRPQPPAPPAPAPFARPQPAQKTAAMPAAPAPSPAAKPAELAPAHALYAQAFGGRPPPAPAPAAADDDDDDDDIRTVMRTPEQLANEDSVDANPRTMMLSDDQQPQWGGGFNANAPRPAAGQPAPAPPKPAGPPGNPAPWAEGPSPQPTMSLPKNFEPTPPGFQAQPAAALGASSANNRGPAPTLALSIDQVGMLGGLAAPGDLSSLEAPLPQQPQNNPMGPPGAMTTSGGNPMMGPPGGMMGPPGGMTTSGGMMGPNPMMGPPGAMMTGQQPMPMTAPEPRSSKKGLIIAALVALVLAAGATFAFLKFKGL
jgi:hypothetical protein